MGKRSRIMAVFLAVLMMAAFMPAVTRDVYAGMYDVDFTEYIGGLKDGKIEQGSTISIDAEKVIESDEKMLESYMEHGTVEVMLKTYSPSDMIGFDYNSSTGIASLNVSADKADAGYFVNVVIVIGGTGGDLFYSPAIDVVEKPASETPTPAPQPQPVTAAPTAPAEIRDLPAVKISKPAASRKAVTVKWKKVSKKNRKKIQGIEVQVATDKGFTQIVRSTKAGKKKVSKVVKGLKAKTTYWVRIRAYRNAADGKHVSAWKVKKVKTK